MRKTQFEQLIEYVINDEDAKAQELFHQIVVSKSRQIYENLMQEGENEMGLTPTEIDTDMSEGDMMGGSQTGDMIDDVEAEESGMHEGEDDSDSDVEFDDEAEADGEDLTKDMEADNDMEMDDEEQTDRILDLEDKLDELMAQFEEMMGGSDMGDDMGDDDMTDMEIDADEFETEGMMENVSLKAAPKPVTSEPAGTNTKSTTAFNSGAAGMEGKPVKMTGDTAKGRPAPTAKEMPDYQGDGHYGKPGPAPKPVTTQAAGVNTRTPFPKGK